MGYLATEAARRALDLAAREAADRGTDLLVIHVVEMLDDSVVSAHRASVSDEVEAALREADLTGLDWAVHVSTEDESVADALVDAALEQGAELLMIGSRPRSSVGKLLFGSVSQTIARRGRPDDVALEVRVVDL